MFLTSAEIVPEFNIDIDSIKEMMDGFDPAVLLPEVGGMASTVATICRIAVMAGPLIILLMGIAYRFLAPKEANHYFGYRTVFGMGSVSAWRHTQKVAGYLFMALGAILSVAMLLIASTFTAADPMATVWRAVTCLLWEAALALILNLSLNSIAMFTFDYNGNRRSKKKRKKRRI